MYSGQRPAASTTRSEQRLDREFALRQESPEAENERADVPEADVQAQEEAKIDGGDPERIRRGYAVLVRRVDPIEIVYLWPKLG